jgi:hypothetical protein
LQYVKNIAFTKLIKVKGVQREFNFRRKYVAGQPVYDIDAPDERGNRHYVSAFFSDNKWMIREIGIPSWMEDAATDFHLAIEGEEATETSRR